MNRHQRRMQNREERKLWKRQQSVEYQESLNAAKQLKFEQERKSEIALITFLSMLGIEEAKQIWFADL